MIVELINLPKRHSSSKMFEAVLYYAEALVGKKMKGSLKVRIVFKSGMRKNEKLHGECLWEDDNCRPREFSLIIDDSLGIRTTYIALAHEMIHVKQYVRGELKDYLRGPFLSKWKDIGINTREFDYWDLPWEKEAHKMETDLYASFKEHWDKAKTCSKKSLCSSPTITLVCKKSHKE